MCGRGQGSSPQNTEGYHPDFPGAVPHLPAWGFCQQADGEWDIRWLGVAFAAVGLPGKDASQEAERWRCRFQRDYGQSLLLVLGLIVAGLSDQQRGNEAQSSQKATEEKALLESLQGIGTDPLE